MSRCRKAVLATCAATLLVAPSAWATHGHDPKPSPRDRDAREFVGDVSVKKILSIRPRCSGSRAGTATRARC